MADWLSDLIARKHDAGRNLNQGRDDEWAGWTREDFSAAIAGELMDACCYLSEELVRFPDVTPEQRCRYTTLLSRLGTLRQILSIMGSGACEAAVAVAEADAEREAKS